MLPRLQLIHFINTITLSLKVSTCLFSQISSNTFPFLFVSQALVPTSCYQIMFHFGCRVCFSGITIILFWEHHLPPCGSELEYCITAMSPSRTAKCITCMNQVVISNLWGSLAVGAHVRTGRRLSATPSRLSSRSMTLRNTPDAFCLRKLRSYGTQLHKTSSCLRIILTCVEQQQLGGSHNSPHRKQRLVNWLQTFSKAFWGIRANQRFLEALPGRRLIWVWAEVGTEVGMEHHASVLQPNLLAAIDIPFPLSLLSCFAFKGFALSPQCPSCHILCRSTTITHSFYHPGNKSRAKPHGEPPIPDILIDSLIY